MPPVNVPWPLSSSPGARPAESAGRLIGCYAEPKGDQGPLWRRSPGLSAFATTGLPNFRGALLVNNLVYAALQGSILTIDANGNIGTIGAFSGTKKVTWARNQAPVPDIQVVDPDNGAFAVTSSVTSFNGGGNLPQPNSVSAQDAYFFWTIGDNRVFAAGPNSTVVNSLTFTTIQSKPTGRLLRGIPYKGVMLFFCTNYCEAWSDTSITFPAFPYSRLKVIDVGLIGASAIAGWEDGFGDLLWGADDFSVQRMVGLDPVKVSSPDVDRFIKAADPTTLEASCYVHAGHKFWAISSPSATWEFNLGTTKWNERRSYLAGQNTQNLFTRWRATGSVPAFGKWLVGDQQTGNLGFVDDTVFKEFGNPLLMRMDSGEADGFPAFAKIARADFDFVVGQGNPQGLSQNEVNPSVLISWSDDGGVTFGVPVPRLLGQLGDYKRNVNVAGTGRSSAAGRRWRIQITDPVYVGFMGSTQSRYSRLGT